MITGSVNAEHEAVVRLRLQGPEGQEQDVDAVMDTGFNGFLSLPPALLTAPGCPRIGLGRALLANGSSELFDLHEVVVLWDGQPRTVEADAADTDALMGMSLIDGHELRIRATDGGLVTIEAFA